MAQGFMRRLAGPGLIFTGSAIGTSHLVQSTRAGALYGLASFVIAPLVALLNHLVVTRCEMPDDARPAAAAKALNITGIVTMTALAAMYFRLTL